MKTLTQQEHADLVLYITAIHFNQKGLTKEQLIDNILMEEPNSLLILDDLWRIVNQVFKNGIVFN